MVSRGSAVLRDIETTVATGAEMAERAGRALRATADRIEKIREARLVRPRGSVKPYVHARSICPIIASGPRGLASAACGSAAMKGRSPAFGRLCSTASAAQRCHARVIVVTVVMPPGIRSTSP